MTTASQSGLSPLRGVSGRTLYTVVCITAATNTHSLFGILGDQNADCSEKNDFSQVAPLVLWVTSNSVRWFLGSGMLAFVHCVCVSAGRREHCDKRENQKVQQKTG